MGTFGERLRREREKRGIGLDEIATATKISARNLRALEDEKFNQLPGGIFNRGFVRAYAKFLGIDEEEVVAQYIAASQDTEEAREEKLKTELSKQEIRKDTDEEERAITLEPKSQWGSIAVIVLLAVLAYGAYSVYQKKKAERSQREQSVPTVTVPQSAPAPSSTSPGTVNPAAEETSAAPTPASSTPTNQPATDIQPAAPSPAAPSTSSPVTVPSPPTHSASAVNSSAASSASTPINLTMKVKEETWVEVKADGKTLISATLSAGTERSFKANDKVEVKLGKAAGVEISYNGKPVAYPSNIQDVRHLTFTPTGYE